MAEFIDQEETQADYVPALTLGPSSGVRQISFSLLASAGDPTTVYPCYVRFWQYPRNPDGTWDASQNPVRELFERRFAGGSQGVLARGVGGVEFRSDPAAAGPATVYAEMDFYSDVDVSGGAVTGAIIAASGSSSTRQSNVITGIVASSGAIIAGTGFTVVHAGTGRYTIAYAHAFAAAPVVLVEITQSVGAPLTRVVNGSAAGCEIDTFDTSLSDISFSFIAQAVQ